VEKYMLYDSTILVIYNEVLLHVYTKVHSSTVGNTKIWGRDIEDSQRLFYAEEYYAAFQQMIFRDPNLSEKSLRRPR
jgi:hypothetical protein